MENVLYNRPAAAEEPAPTTHLEDIPLHPQLLPPSAISSTPEKPTYSVLNERHVIDKRRRTFIIVGAFAVVVLLALGIGLIAGMREKNHSSKGSSSRSAAHDQQQQQGQQGQFDQEQQNATSTQDPPINSFVANSYKKGLVIDWKAIHDDSVYITPQVVDKFLRTVRNLSAAVGLDVPQLTISRQSLIMMMREIRDDVLPVWEILGRYARLDLNLYELGNSTLEALAKNVTGMMSRAQINRWGYIMAQRHANTAVSGQVPSMEDLMQLAKSRKLELPDTTPNFTGFPAAPSPVNRKLLAPVWHFPETCIPIVFHVLQYYDPAARKYSPGLPNSYAPPAYHANFTHLVDRLNRAFRNSELPGGNGDTRMRFYIKEVRTAAEHSYLGLAKAEDWNNCWSDDMAAGGKWLFRLTENFNVDVTQHINVWVCGLAAGKRGESCLDAEDGSSRCPAGYSWVPQLNQTDGAGNEKWKNAHIHMLWDNVDERLDGRADGLTFHRGGWNLAHYVAHHMGLWHTHDVPAKMEACVQDGDMVTDTATTQVVSQQRYFGDLVEMCDIWRQGKAWPNREVWSSSQNVTLSECDSCPNDNVFDPVFNIMSFTAPSCTSYFTQGQVYRMWYSAMAFRPTLVKKGTSLLQQLHCVAQDSPAPRPSSTNAH